MASLVAYNSILTDATSLTATSSSTAGPVDNLKTLTEWDRWTGAGSGGTYYITIQQSGSVNPDYVAIHGHNLADEAGVAVTLEHSTDNFSADINTAATLTVTDGVIFDQFTQVGADDYWRLKIVTSSLVPSIGVLAVGLAVELESGMRGGFKPALTGGVKDYAAVSEGGNFLGRSIIDTAESMSISLTNLTPAWVRSTYLDFLTHAKDKPFFFVWDATNYESEAAYCWVDSKVDSPKYQDSIYMSHALKVMAKI